MVEYERRRIRRLIRVMRDHNEFPLDLPRHFQPFSSHPVSRVLREAVDSVREQLLSASEVGLRTLYSSLQWHWREMLSMETLLGRSADAREALAVYLLADQLQTTFFSIEDALAAGPDDRSAVFEVYPELRTLHTDEGLMILRESMDARPQGIFYKDHVLHYHQLLRRGYASNPNMEFLKLLTSFHRANPGAKVGVALDHRRLMPKEFFRAFFEKDTWYGPPFRTQDLDNPEKVGLTVLARSDPSVDPRNATMCRLNGIERCEVLWTYRDGIKIVQIEEVRSTRNSEGLTINRYVHSLRHLPSGTFVHLDGACKIYSAEQSEERLRSRMSGEPRARQKPKLFRVDGKIALNAWSELVSYFYHGNPLILEYFSRP